jgi:hypothetical protein
MCHTAGHSALLALSFFAAVGVCTDDWGVFNKLEVEKPPEPGEWDILAKIRDTHPADSAAKAWADDFRRKKQMCWDSQGSGSGKRCEGQKKGSEEAVFHFAVRKAGCRAAVMAAELPPLLRCLRAALKNQVLLETENWDGERGTERCMKAFAVGQESNPGKCEGHRLSLDITALNLAVAKVLADMGRPDLALEQLRSACPSRLVVSMDAAPVHTALHAVMRTLQRNCLSQLSELGLVPPEEQCALLQE